MICSLSLHTTKEHHTKAVSTIAFELQKKKKKKKKKNGSDKEKLSHLRLSRFVVLLLEKKRLRTNHDLYRTLIDKKNLTKRE